MTHPDEQTIHAAQTLNAETGVAPTPAYFQRGEEVPSVLACVYDDTDAMAACALATMRYHPEGPLGGWIFAGGVSVDPQRQGLGLGTLINAHVLVDSHCNFRWSSVLEQAKKDNMASIKMILRCGLLQDEKRATILVNKTSGSVTR